MQDNTESKRSDTELTETQTELIENLRTVAVNRMKDQPVSGLGELRIADYFHELFRVRNERNAAVEADELERGRELTDRIDDLLRDLKRVGAPYHPAFGNRDDWERLDASDPAKRDYDWHRKSDR